MHSPWKQRVFAFVFVLLATSATAAEPKDAPACVGKDHPLFTRMPGYYLGTGSTCKERQFAREVFATSNEQKKRMDKAVEGHWYEFEYHWRGQGPSPSGLQVGRNYANAATAAGGEVMFQDSYGATTVRFVGGGKETWAAVKTGGSQLRLRIVEVEGMKQDILANAEALKGGLATNGHVELKGIFFDTGKSDLKPESEPALAEVEKLLKAQPALAMWVVGHTDSVGGVDPNLALSQARATAVVKALVEQRGIDAARLASFGAGPFAPVATNATDEGRARNRRVELVAR